MRRNLLLVLSVLLFVALALVACGGEAQSDNNDRDDREDDDADRQTAMANNANNSEPPENAPYIMADMRGRQVPAGFVTTMTFGDESIEFPYTHLVGNIKQTDSAGEQVLVCMLRFEMQDGLPPADDKSALIQFEVPLADYGSAEALDGVEFDMGMAGSNCTFIFPDHNYRPDADGFTVSFGAVDGDSISGTFSGSLSWGRNNESTPVEGSFKAFIGYWRTELPEGM